MLVRNGSVVAVQQAGLVEMGVGGKLEPGGLHSARPCHRGVHQKPQVRPVRAQACVTDIGDPHRGAAHPVPAGRKTSVNTVAISARSLCRLVMTECGLKCVNSTSPACCNRLSWCHRAFGCIPGFMRWYSWPS